MDKKEHKKEEIKGLSKEIFKRDPVAFGALMGFQYGEGKDQKTAEQLLLEETKGIACKIEELSFILPNFNFWSLEEKDREPKRWRLYMNDKPASLLGAMILQDVGLSFEVVRVDADALRVYNFPDRVYLDFRSGKYPLPILVDLLHGVTACSLQEVKNRARLIALQKFGKPEKPEYSGHSYYLYYPYHIDFSKGGWYRDENNELQCAEVWCFNEKNELVFLGKIRNAPYPVSEMLKAHWYVQRVGEKAFSELVCWDLGLWHLIRERKDERGHLIQPDPPVVLFVDEVKALENGQKQQLIVDDHSDLLSVGYDGYFLIDGHLYRIYGRKYD